MSNFFSKFIWGFFFISKSLLISANNDTSNYYQLTDFERKLIADYAVVLDTLSSDSLKIIATRKMYSQMYDNDVWIQFAEKLKSYLDSYKKIKGETHFYKYQLLQYYEDKAYYASYKENDKSAVIFYIKAYRIAKDLQRNDLLYPYLNNVGQYLHKIGQFEKAITFINLSFKILEKSKQYAQLGLLQNNLGYIYYEQGEFEQAMNYYNRALSIGFKLRDSSLMALVYNNQALIFNANKDYSRAEYAINKSIKLRESIGEEARYAQALNNLASIYIYQKKYNEAIKIIHKAYEIKQKNNDLEALVYSFYTLSKIYLQTENLDSSLYYSRKAFQIADFYKYPYMYAQASDMIYQIFDKRNQLDSAYVYYKLYITMRDSVFNEKNINAAIKQKLKNDFEKKEAIIQAQKESEVAVANAEKQKQKIINYFIAFMLLAVSIVAYLIYRSLKLSQKQKKIIQLQKEQSDKQRKLVEEKNKEILDSIHYAKRIQLALITSETYIEKHLKRLLEQKNKG